METEGNTGPTANQRKDLRTRCPFCVAMIDVNLDKRDRPYWVCVSCQTRTFATRITLKRFTAWGWIWRDEPPLEALQRWMDQVAIAAGLKKPKKEK